MKSMTYTGTAEEEPGADKSIFEVYPNPNKNGIINIKNPQYIQFDKVRIYDLTGNLVYTKELFIKDLDQYQLDISGLHLKPGLYMIDILNKDGSNYHEKVEVF
jgi:hypothetical protein